MLNDKIENQYIEMSRDWGETDYSYEIELKI